MFIKLSRSFSAWIYKYVAAILIFPVDLKLSELGVLYVQHHICHVYFVLNLTNVFKEIKNSCGLPNFLVLYILFYHTSYWNYLKPLVNSSKDSWFGEEKKFNLHAKIAFVRWHATVYACNFHLLANFITLAGKSAWPENLKWFSWDLRVSVHAENGTCRPSEKLSGITSCVRIFLLSKEW